jgi:hypothetical protein
MTLVAVSLTLPSIGISVSATRSDNPKQVDSRGAASIDNTTFIDANRILMFVTNHGNFGRDLSGYFGNDYGTYYPFTTEEAISSGANVSSVLYAAGIWIGGVDVATDDTLVTVSEFSSEYVPGPMTDLGAYLPDNPAFRVYKLYVDSLESNPNQDYLDWAVSQGAPFDGEGKPAMIGKQMLWSVFNDANPVQHTNNNGQTLPLGIEIQQTVWAANDYGDVEVPIGGTVEVSPPANPTIEVAVQVVELGDLTGHDYTIVTDSTDTDFVWHLIDVTADDTLIANFPLSSTNTQVTDGFLVTASVSPQLFDSFEVAANAAGPVDPPEPGAFSFAGFPVPAFNDPDGFITDAQQATNSMKWGIHTADNGGSCGDGTRPDYDAFLERSLRNGTEPVGFYDYEMRFTGSYDNPGVNGSYAIEWYNDDNVFWMPFELWRTGINTPDDPSDDIRLVPWIIDDGMDDTYNLESWGCVNDVSFGGDGEHSTSSADDDPFTDWVYWRMPTDSSFGEAGYLANEVSMLGGNYDDDLTAYEIFGRTVLVAWNGGDAPPFDADRPEQGTVFRLVTGHQHVPGEVFTIHTTPLDSVSVGPEQQALYVKYKLINKGGKDLRDVLIAMWLDPDLGGAGDDLVGCDIPTDVMFCYNSTGSDSYYGYACPALGVKLVEGPIVPASESDTATVDGIQVPGYRNLKTYSFNMYFNGTDPDNFVESYQYMNGLNPKSGGVPFIDPTTMQITRYVYSGDPVTGTGWLDGMPDDRRMMASYGPFDFAPNDTQQVVLKLAVGHGFDRLGSITAMREILEYEPITTDVDDLTDAALPVSFAVDQNYPNPFNPSTTINYSLPERAEVTVTVYNVLGQKVTTLFNGEQPAGPQAVVWDGKDADGNAAATGVYFYRVKAGDAVDTKKMMLLK